MVSLTAKKFFQKAIFRPVSVEDSCVRSVIAPFPMCSHSVGCVTARQTQSVTQKFHSHSTNAVIHVHGESQVDESGNYFRGASHYNRFSGANEDERRRQRFCRNEGNISLG